MFKNFAIAPNVMGQVPFGYLINPLSASPEADITSATLRGHTINPSADDMKTRGVTCMSQNGLVSLCVNGASNTTVLAAGRSIHFAQPDTQTKDTEETAEMKRFLREAHLGKMGMREIEACRFFRDYSMLLDIPDAAKVYQMTGINFGSESEKDKWVVRIPVRYVRMARIVGFTLDNLKEDGKKRLWTRHMPYVMVRYGAFPDFKEKMVTDKGVFMTLDDDDDDDENMVSATQPSTSSTSLSSSSSSASAPAASAFSSSISSSTPINMSAHLDNNTTSNVLIQSGQNNYAHISGSGNVCVQCCNQDVEDDVDITL
jgi:hypothetical protein